MAFSNSSSSSNSNTSLGNTQQPTTMRIYLHSELSTTHASHGVAYEDYAQYSSYCTRRLSRLRHGKGVKKELLHCRMYKSAFSTKVEEGKEGAVAVVGSSKSRLAYRAIDMTNLPSEVLASNANYFWEPLYCAERCWAASMAIKAESNGIGSGRSGDVSALGGGNDPKKNWSPGKIRAHSIKRLRKAVKFATMLETLAMSTEKSQSVDEEETDENGESDGAKPPVDEHTQMEARAYASWMRGNLALEQNQWQTACNEYQMALTLCKSLANDSSGNQNGHDDETKEDGNQNAMQKLELFDFFTTRAQNVIAPLLRYCHYELQEKGMSPTEKISFLESSSSISDIPNDPLQSKLHLLKAQTLQNQATTGASMSQITFRENIIAVETKESRMALLKIQDLEGEWEKDKKGSTSNNTNNNANGGSDAKFMALLSGYDDAISLTNQELKQLATLKSGPAVNAKKFQLVNILGYCKYQKLKLVMGRNEDLANGIIRRNKKRGMTLKHFEEVAHLYDALLQDARAVASLPGGGSPDDFDGNTTTTSTASGVEDEFLLEANAKILRLRSLRCYYLVQMHASPLVHKYEEALALLDQAESLALEASEEIGACDQMEGGDELLENLESVLEEMRGEKCRILAVSYLSQNTLSATTSGKPLLERLHDYDVPSTATTLLLTRVPPKLEPMACKPSFFDVALNYVSDYPVEELNQALEEHNNGKSSTASKGFLGWFRR